MQAPPARGNTFRCSKAEEQYIGLSALGATWSSPDYRNQNSSQASWSWRATSWSSFPLFSIQTVTPDQNCGKCEREILSCECLIRCFQIARFGSSSRSFCQGVFISLPALMAITSHTKLIQFIKCSILNVLKVIFLNYYVLVLSEVFFDNL